MLLSLLLAALTETTTTADRRASAHEVARRLGVPWRRDPPPAMIIPRTRIELWAQAMRRLWALHPEDILARKAALVALFTRLHAFTGRVTWVRKLPMSESELAWVREHAGSEDLRSLFFDAPSIDVGAGLSGLLIFPVWTGEGEFYVNGAPLSAFPTFNPAKARLFFHIARALGEHPGPVGGSRQEGTGSQWEERMIELLDWAEAMHPDLSRMTWAEMGAGAAAMHRALAQTTAVDIDWRFGGPIPDAWVLASGPGGWTVQRLLTKADFAAEGTSMAHCIGGPVRDRLGRPDGESEYFQRSRDNKAIYLSVREAGVPRATVEISGEPGTWTFDQVQGPRDGDIESGAAAALVRGLEVCGMLERQDSEFHLHAGEDAYRKVHRGLSHLPLDEIGPRRLWAQAVDWYSASAMLEDLARQWITPARVLLEVRNETSGDMDSGAKDVAREIRVLSVRILSLLGERGTTGNVDWIADGAPNPDGTVITLSILGADLWIRLTVGVDEGETWSFPWVRRMAISRLVPSDKILREVRTPDSLFEAFVTLLGRTPNPPSPWTFRADQVPHPDLLEAWTEKNGVSSVDGWAAPTDVALAATGRAKGRP